MPESTNKNTRPTPLDRDGRWVAEVETTDVLTRDQLLPDEAPRGIWGSAWINLRRRPMFWVSVVIIALVLLIALFPGLFSGTDPRARTSRTPLRAPAPAIPSASRSRGMTSTPAPSTVPARPSRPVSSRRWP